MKIKVWTGGVLATETLLVVGWGQVLVLEEKKQDPSLLCRSRDHQPKKNLRKVISHGRKRCFTHFA
jgi:hypothetical protein